MHNNVKAVEANVKRASLFVLAAILVGWVFPVQAETVNLTYSNFFPPTHVQSQLAEAWCKEVETRTNGDVKVAYFPGGTLTKAPQIYDGVVQGLSDVGMSALGYTRGRFPVMSTVDLPLGYNSGVAATEVANALYEQFKPAEFDETQVMFFHAHGPGVLHTAKKPVRTLEDLAGLKLRATGNSAKLVEALGASPVAMSMPDSYQAIQKGVVNGGMYPIETNKGWKMAEVVDYCTNSQAVGYTTNFFVVMNKDKWAKISPENQKIIMDINKEFALKHGQAWDESDKVGLEFFKSDGGEVIDLAPEEVERWKAKAAPMMTEYVEELNSKGLDGKAILDFTVQKLQSVN